MPVCAKCYAEFPENDCVFCPDSGYLCSSCSNQEHVVVCLDCGEHFLFYSMKEIDGRALCEEDYKKELSEKEPDVKEIQIDIHKVEEASLRSEITINSLENAEGIESIEEIEYTKKTPEYDAPTIYDESDIPWMLEKIRKGEHSESDGKDEHIISEEIIRDTHHAHHKCHGHHPISF